MTELSRESLSLPPFEAPLPRLVAGMDDEEAALVVGLGLLVREGAAVEYTLHGILAHLDAVEKPFTYKAATRVSVYVTQCRERLEAMAGNDDAAISPRWREVLLADLAECSECLEKRNRFVHGTWAYDDERQTWLTVRGRPKAKFPEIVTASSEELWELADALGQLNERLIAWDTEHFGVPGDPELGQPDRVSSKAV